MKNKKTRIFGVVLAALLICIITTGALVAFAEGPEPVVTTGELPPEAASPQPDESSDGVSAKAIAAAIAVGLAAAAGAIGMGLAIAKSTESMARQPEMANKINSAMMLGLVFIETVILYALIVAILIIFVL